MSITGSTTNDRSVSNMDMPDSNNESTSSLIYSTGFCTTAESCTDLAYKVFFGSATFICFVYIIWNYDKFKPFTGSIFTILKSILLYTIIMVVFTLLLKGVSGLYWWYNLFYWYAQRLINPLVDVGVSSWYYYFTDYVNPIVYGGATLWYLIICLALGMVLFLVIIPALSFIGFFMGYLFSLMGSDRCGKINPPDSGTTNTFLGKEANSKPELISNFKVTGIKSLSNLANQVAMANPSMVEISTSKPLSEKKLENLIPSGKATYNPLTVKG